MEPIQHAMIPSAPQTVMHTSLPERDFMAVLLAGKIHRLFVSVNRPARAQKSACICDVGGTFSRHDRDPQPPQYRALWFYGHWEIIRRAARGRAIAFRLPGH